MSKPDQKSEAKQTPDTVKTDTAKLDAVKPDETIAELRARLDEMSKALGLKPSDEDLQRLHERLDSVSRRIEAKLNPLHFAELKPVQTVPGFEPMPKIPEAWHPGKRDGMLILKYTGETGAIISPLKGPKPLPTGVKLIVPEGYRCCVAQLRAHGACEVLQNVFTLRVGTSAEIKVICTARDHAKATAWPVSPGTEIGAAWLERI